MRWAGPSLTTMRVLYIQQFFPGEGSPGSQQPFSLVRELARRGHWIDVLAADYNIDSAEREPEATGDAGQGGFHVHRLPCVRGGRGSNAARMRAYLHFMLSAFWIGKRLPNPDVVVGSIQPMFAGLAGYFLAKRARAPFLLEVRDLWPDALVVKGAISPFQARPLHAIVGLLYRKSCRIVSLTPGIKIELVGKGIPPGKIDVFPNGWDPVLFSKVTDTRQEVRDRLGWNNDVVAIYAGSFQDVTSVETHVLAAKRLEKTERFRLVLFGNGPTRTKVQALAQSIGVRNLSFCDPVPKRDVPALLGAADIALMALFKTPLAHIYFENKLMDYMGAGLPIAAAMDGEQARVIREVGCGIVVPPLNDEGLAEGIRRLSNETQMRSEMGARGKAFVESRLRLPDILDRYARVIEACAQGIDDVPAWEPL